MLCSTLYHCGLTCFVQICNNNPQEGSHVGAQTDLKRHPLAADSENSNVVFIDQSTQTLPAVSSVQTIHVKEPTNRRPYSEARSLDNQELVFRKSLCSDTKKSGVYCVQNVGKTVNFLSKYSLDRNNNIFSMIRTQYATNFFVAKYYCLQNNTSWGS
jgi:hypothetical protein